MAGTENEMLFPKRFQKLSSNCRHGAGVIEIRPCENNLSYIEEIDTVSDNEKSLFSRSCVHHMYHRYPFGFRTPENCSSSCCRWIYPITFGGGLVGGDQIEAKFDIGQKCCVALCTQESTKVYHCLKTKETTSQFLDYALQPGCLLCVLPDPLVCYKDARFHQKQTFHLSPTSNLVFLDWLQAGRKALGESWHFERCCSTIEVYFSNKLVLRECNDLRNDQAVDLNTTMGNFQFLGTCIILGPYLDFLSQTMMEEFGCKKDFGERQSDNLVVSVSPLSYTVDGGKLQGCFVRFLATDMKAASVVIRALTKPLLSDLGADPFERKL